nr:hypothetical protein [uncultured Desulfovibrio sp.]
MTFEFGKENRWHDQYFGTDLAVTTDGADTDALAVGQHLGALAITVCANGAVDATSLELTFKESDTENGTFEAPAAALKLTIAGTFADGQTIGKMLLPDCKSFVKANLKGTATGKVDVFLSYIAR